MLEAAVKKRQAPYTCWLPDLDSFFQGLKEEWMVLWLTENHTALQDAIPREV